MKAELEYFRYRVRLDSQPRPVDADFENAVAGLGPWSVFELPKK